LMSWRNFVVSVMELYILDLPAGKLPILDFCKSATGFVNLPAGR
jgi:hypothetical protein